MYRRLSCLISLLCLASVVLAQAQVVSNGKLSAQVSPGESGNYIIIGGDRAGDNVFYGFDQFCRMGKVKRAHHPKLPA